MRFSVLTFLLILMTSVMPTKASPVPDFSCDVPDGTVLDRDGFKLGEFLYLYEETLALVGYAEPSEQVKLSDSHGAINYYGDGDFRVAIFPGGAQIELKGGQVIPCQTYVEGPAVSEDSAYISVEMYGMSYGSTVRSSPDLGDNKIDRLPEGEPIYLLGNVGQTYDGYDWFEIEYSEGVKGFVWGGTLCSNGSVTPGIANAC